MKRYAASFLMLAILLSAGAPAMAQTKMGYVDIDKVVRESKVAQQAQKALEAEFSARDGDLAKRAERFNKMKADLDKEYVTLGDLDRQERERALNDANLDLQRRQRLFNEDLNQRRNEELAAVLARTGEAVKRIAEAENFDIVFREAVWINPAIDLTNKVMKALDEVRAPAAK